MARNYHMKGYTFDQVTRIALRLAVSTGVARLAWMNSKGRAHIIFEGQGGYQRTISGGVSHVTGNVPPRSHVGEVVEAIPHC